MAGKTIICAGNWKMNKSPQEAEVFLRDLRSCQLENNLKGLVLFLPAINLVVASDILKACDIGWGAQNCYPEDSGAFTGENSPAIIKGLGATHCLVGHSERRRLFSESNEFCAQKVAAIQRHEMIPVLCLGETLEQRQKGETNQVIVEQLKGGLAEVNREKPFWLAYEPVWAIGTGRVATSTQVNQAHTVLRAELIEMLGENLGRETPLLYGGSVKPENAYDLAMEKEVDGFLIGGASLHLDNFVKLAQIGL